MEGNVVDKLRDALKSIKDINDSRPHDAKGYEINDIITDAIALPLRQCDVGTAEEQTKRFSDFCAVHRHTDLPWCAGCPLENTPSDTGCSFAWAQMPYEAEEGGAK